MALLDTSFLIDVIRGDQDAAVLLAELEGRGETLIVPSIALFELYRGLAGARIPARERARVDEALRARPVASFDADAARSAGELDGSLGARGRKIDPEDVMIAGIAISKDETLVTRDVKHFANVEKLRVLSY